MSFSIDVSESNFQQEVLDRSMSVPVIVDFWAPWCGPCQTLKPLLEKLADEFKGKFILAKVNADENKLLAGKFDVRGIPSVKAIYKGNVVNEFSGALPESAIRDFVQKILPSKIDALVQQANSLITQGDLDQASAILQQAESLEEDSPQIKVAQLKIALEKKDFPSAHNIIRVLPINITQDDEVKELIVKLELMENSANLPSQDELLRKIQINGDDLQSRLDLANLLISQNQYEQGIEQLFEIIKRDREFQGDIGRKTLLNTFTLLGSQHQTVRSARKKLALLLN